MLKILRMILGWGHYNWHTKKSPFRFIVISRIGHKLTSEAELNVDIHDFNVATLFEKRDISPSVYVTCMFNSFW